MKQTDCCSFDDFLNAMADENRQRILTLLQRGEMSVGELQTHFDLSQPTISHHLAVMRRARLVFSRREGKYVYYRANPDCVAKQCQEILTRFRIGAISRNKGG
ncbi:MAG: ArsR/SmtB family transcription factor [Chloroflexota bacterium]